MPEVIEFFEKTVIFLLSIAAFLAFFIGILFFLQKRIKRKVEMKVMQKESGIILKRSTENLKNLKKPPEEVLQYIDRLVRKFFAEEYKIRRGLDYLEMCDFFRKKKESNASQLCENMTEALFSGEQLTKNKVDSLLKSLEKLIDNKVKPDLVEAEREFQEREQIVPLNKDYQKQQNIKIIKPEKRIIEIYTVKEPKQYKNISTIDNLDRIKEKIDNLSKLRKYNLPVESI